MGEWPGGRSVVCGAVRGRASAWLSAILAGVLLVAGCGVESGSDTKLIGGRSLNESARSAAETAEVGESEQTAEADESAESAETDTTEQEPAADAEPGSTDSVGIDEWRRQMEEVCLQADATLAGVNPTDDAELAAAVIESMKVRNDLMRRLPRPEGHEAAVEQLLALVDAAVADAGVLGAEAIVEEFSTTATERAAELEVLVDELGVADCGENAESTSEICSLIDDEPIVALLGRVPPPESNAQFGVQGCEWGSMADDNAVSVLIGPVAGYEMNIEWIREIGEPLPGLGDEAYLADGFSITTGGSTRGSTVWVIAGDKVYAAGAIVDDEAGDTDVLIAMVTTLLDDAS